MHAPLKGKTALITGGSRGMGAATAKKLAVHGARIAITYHTQKEKAQAIVKTIEAMGGEAIALHADAAKPETMPRLVSQIMEAYGRLDILVNNAGVFETPAMIGDIPQEVIERTLTVNVTSLFTLAQAAVKVLADHGRIINISSVLGERAIFPGVSAYTASKFAVAGMTRAWAWELAPRNITVNAVQPGPINTDMGDPNAAGLTALKRLGEPEEVAALIAFLASPEASYITGSTIRVDGGVNA